MKKTFYVWLLSLLLPLGLVAQVDSVLYGLNFAGNTLRFAEADITNGQVSLPSNMPIGGSQFASGISDLDAAGGRYFYVQGNEIVTVDIQSGTVISSQQITSTSHPISPFMPVVNIAWNPVDNMLYCLHFQGNNLRFAVLNPTTGYLTVLTPNPISQANFSSGVSDIDPVGRRYFFVRGNRLITVDINNGTVLNDVVLDNSSSATKPITNIAYNWVTDQIFGLNFKEELLDNQGFPIAPAELRLATVNPVTGKVDIISRSPISEAQFESGVSDIHFSGNFYTYVRGGAFSREVISVDISTGEVIWQPTLYNPNNAISPLTNISYAKDFTAASFLPISDFKYDSLSWASFSFRDESRYAKQVYWDFGDGFASTDRYPWHTYSSPGQYTVSLITENSAGKDTLTKVITVGTFVAVEEQIAPEWTVYPNPATDVVRLRSSSTNSMDDILLQLVDIQGRVINQKNVPAFHSGEEMQLEIPHNAPNGVYFLRVVSELESRNFRLLISK